MKTSHKKLKILAQIFLFILIINYSLCFDKKALIKKDLNSYLRFLSETDSDNLDTDDTDEATEPTDKETEKPSEALTEKATSGNITIPEEVETTRVTSAPINTTGDIVRRKSSSGLSAGAICAIAIPTIAALLGAAAAAALCKGGAAPPVFTPPALPPPNIIDTSLEQFNVVQQIPPPQPVPQVTPVTPVHIEPQPLPQVVRPVYPINQAEPPLVNRAFQPLYNIQQPMQMVPVQQVQMVPVQQVQMVPVEEVVPVQQVEQIQQVQNVQNVVQELIPQTVETLPSITPVNDTVGATEIAGGQIVQQGPAVGNSSGLGFSVQNLI